jgi:hypothetical protein
MMSKPHKWAKEIKCFIDGGEVERKNINANEWLLIKDIGEFSIDYMDYRIKPQTGGCKACVTCGQLVEDESPKKSKYLYAYMCRSLAINGLEEIKLWHEKTPSPNYLGKIKLEDEDA